MSQVMDSLVAQAIDGDRQARQLLVEQNQGLAVHKVGLFVRMHPEYLYLYDDMVANAFLAMVQAINGMAEAGTNLPGLLSRYIQHSISATVRREVSQSTGISEREVYKSATPQRASSMPEMGHVNDETADFENHEFLAACCESDEERAVARLMLEGLNRREIAEKLGLSQWVVYQARAKIRARARAKL